jgi:Arc/MetJ-type ribon-helix-helix transcriptional regulator
MEWRRTLPVNYPFPPELHQISQEGLASGAYGSEDAMLLEAMRLLRDRDQHEQSFHAELQTRIDRLDRGEGLSLEGEQELRKFFDDIMRPSGGNALRL